MIIFNSTMDLHRIYDEYTYALYYNLPVCDIVIQDTSKRGNACCNIAIMHSISLYIVRRTYTVRRTCIMIQHVLSYPLRYIHCNHYVCIIVYSIVCRTLYDVHVQ